MALETYRTGSAPHRQGWPAWAPFDNNAYLIHDRESNDALIVDAPQDARAIARLARWRARLTDIITHRHGDHWAGLDVIKPAVDATVACHEADRAPYESKVDGTLADGEEIEVGSRARARDPYARPHAG